MESTVEVNNPELFDGPPEPGGAMTKHEPRQTGALVAADSPAALLKLAIEKGVAVEQLGPLVDLHERMDARQARKEFFAALAAFQEEVAPVVRKRKADVATRDGGGMRYNYANVDDILTDVRPTMIKHGLSLRWDQKLEGTNCTIICVVMHVGGHEVPSSFTVPTESRAGMSPQQKVGAGASYAQARVLGIALGITTTDQEPDSEKLDPTPIDDDQLAELQDAIETKEIPVERFLKWMGVDAVGKIRRVDFLKAMAGIDQVAAAKSKKGGAS